MASLIAPSVWLNTRPTSSPVPHLGCRRRRRTWAVIWFSAWCVVVDWGVGTQRVEQSSCTCQPERERARYGRSPLFGPEHLYDIVLMAVGVASVEHLINAFKCNGLVCVVGWKQWLLFACSEGARKCQIMMHVIAIPFFFNIENCTSGDLNAKIFQYKSTFRVQKLFAVVPSFL